MRKSKGVKWGGFSLLGLLLVGGTAFGVNHYFYTSKIVMSNQLENERIMLHNAKGDHACHCFAPFISYFNISDVTATSATFTWDCDVMSSFQVRYGLTADTAEQTFFPDEPGTAGYMEHTITVTGLEPGTTYHCGPSSICLNSDDCYRNDYDGLRKEWLLDNLEARDWTFTTLDETSVLDDNNAEYISASAKIASAGVARITAKYVTITWKTGAPSTSLVEYGQTTEYGMKSGLNPQMVREHDIQLFHLKPGTTYHYRAVSYANDAEATAHYSPDMTFTTPVAEDRIVESSRIYNQPNPCSDRTMFSYYLFQPAKNVTIDVFTLSGKMIATLESPLSALNEGWNKVQWDVRDNSRKLLVNGIYTCKMKVQTINNEMTVNAGTLRVSR